MEPVDDLQKEFNKIYNPKYNNINNDSKPVDEKYSKLYIFTDGTTYGNGNYYTNDISANPNTIFTSVKIDEKTSNEKHWGSYTWELFHTLANKIKPEVFFIIKDKLIEYIVSICSNIFCKSCQFHAIYYIKNNPFTEISNKEDLKVKLFNFHNFVTEYRNKMREADIVRFKPQIPLFLLSDLDSTYDKFILLDVLDEFFKRDFIINDKQLYQSFKEWIYSVLCYFNE
jgi:hypothetical protein